MSGPRDRHGTHANPHVRHAAHRCVRARASCSGVWRHASRVFKCPAEARVPASTWVLQRRPSSRWRIRSDTALGKADGTTNIPNNNTHARTLSFSTYRAGSPAAASTSYEARPRIALKMWKSSGCSTNRLRRMARKASRRCTKRHLPAWRPNMLPACHHTPPERTPPQRKCCFGACVLMTGEASLPRPACDNDLAHHAAPYGAPNPETRTVCRVRAPTPSGRLCKEAAQKSYLTWQGRGREPATQQKWRSPPEEINMCAQLRSTRVQDEGTTSNKTSPTPRAPPMTKVRLACLPRPRRLPEILETTSHASNSGGDLGSRLLRIKWCWRPESRTNPRRLCIRFRPYFGRRTPNTTNLQNKVSGFGCSMLPSRDPTSKLKPNA